ncbi:hypothetical protein TKK_0011372 [Trichogramma kaykai]
MDNIEEVLSSQDELFETELPPCKKIRTEFQFVKNEIYHLLNSTAMGRINTEKFDWIADQLVELFPILEKDHLFIASYSSTEDSIATSEGGTLYWFYKEARKEYRRNGWIEKKIKSLEPVTTTCNPYATFYLCLVDPDREKYNAVEVGNRWNECFLKRADILIEKKQNFTTKSAVYINSFQILN